MSTHIEFARAGALTGGSKNVYGTVQLRTALTSGDYGTIGIGQVESFDWKEGSTDEEGMDESGAHQFLMMLDRSEEISFTARFTTDVPAPAKGMLVQFTVPVTVLTSGGAAGAHTTTNTKRTYLIKEAGWKSGDKEIRKYTISAIRWDSLNADDGATVAVVTTATGAIVGTPYELA